MRTDQFSGLHDMSASAGGVGRPPSWRQTPSPWTEWLTADASENITFPGGR